MDHALQQHVRSVWRRVVHQEDGGPQSEQTVLQGQDLTAVPERTLGQQPKLGAGVEHDARGPDLVHLGEEVVHALSELDLGWLVERGLQLVTGEIARDLNHREPIQRPSVGVSDLLELLPGLGERDVHRPLAAFQRRPGGTASTASSCRRPAHPARGTSARVAGRHTGRRRVRRSPSSVDQPSRASSFDSLSPTISGVTAREGWQLAAIVGSTTEQRRRAFRPSPSTWCRPGHRGPRPPARRAARGACPSARSPSPSAPPPARRAAPRCAPRSSPRWSTSRSRRRSSHAAGGVPRMPSTPPMVVAVARSAARVRAATALSATGGRSSCSLSCPNSPESAASAPGGVEVVVHRLLEGPERHGGVAVHGPRRQLCGRPAAHPLAGASRRSTAGGPRRR